MLKIKLCDLKEMINSVPFINTQNGMTYEQKIAKIAEMNEFCENIIKRNSQAWPEEYKQIVSSHLAWIATHEMLNYPPAIRERELLKLADQLYNDSIFRMKVDSFLMHRKYSPNSLKSVPQPANATLKEEISHILFMMRVNAVSYEEKLAKVARMRILCEKIILRYWSTWPDKYQNCAIDTFLLKALKTLFNYPIEYIEFEIHNWAVEVHNNSNFQTKVEQILKKKKQKEVAHIPFMKKDNGLSFEEKLSVLTEINILTDKIIKDKWNSWPDGFHQFVSGTLIWNALDQLVDSTSKDRERILLRWESELSDNLTFRREVYKFLKYNPQHKPSPT